MGTLGIWVLAITWSLAIEEQFYLTLPLVIRFTPRRRLAYGLARAILITPLMRWLVFHAFASHGIRGQIVVVYVLLPCRTDGLCLGVLIALAYRTPSVWARIVEWQKLVYAALAVFAAAGFVIMLGPSEGTPSDAFGLGYSFAATLYALLLLSVLLAPRLNRIFSCAPLRGLGILAYGLYLFHYDFVVLGFWLVGKFVARKFLSPNVAYAITPRIAVLLFISLAALSWKYFEKPLVKRGHRYKYEEELVSVA